MKKLLPLATLLLAGCASTGKDLPHCLVAEAHLINTPQGAYAAFHQDQLNIFRAATAAEARGECKFPE